MSSTAELIAGVREAVAGTPYVVHETPYGFNLTLDVADAERMAALEARGVRKALKHEVRIDEVNHELSITDVLTTIVRDADGLVPRFSLKASLQRGRISGRSFRRTYARDPETGEYRKESELPFDAGEGRELIRRVARADAGRKRWAPSKRSPPWSVSARSRCSCWGRSRSRSSGSSSC